MKNLFVTLILALTFSLPAQQTGYLGVSNETMQYDKQQHALGGIALGFVSYVYFDSQYEVVGNINVDPSIDFKGDYLIFTTIPLQYSVEMNKAKYVLMPKTTPKQIRRYTNTEIQSYLKSGAFVLAIATLKEANDKWLGGRAFSLDDIGATMFGHFMGATTALIVRRWAKNSNTRHQTKLIEQMARIDSFYD